MASENERRYRQACALKAAIRAKRAHVEKITAQATKHARIAIETNDAKHAAEAIRLRGAVRYWLESIRNNLAALEQLEG